ncbi:MAG: phenylalanine--tRNA ligase subunit beta [Nitrospirae bacterium]|nr:phenylalanine--tRNA ligase subunit beta [Nitrospirota bacterium]
MRVPFEWLKEFIDISLGADEVAHTLTMIGLEVEAVERLGDDAVFEVNVTPNRPDCLSIFGIARELSAALNLSLRLPEYDIKEQVSKDDFRIEIMDEDLCHRYAGRIVKGVKISDSPEWLAKRITKCGTRSINNIVDITNYVLMELGHPLHAFDLNTLDGSRIKVGVAGQVDRIVTLDGLERKLSGDTLLIWDDKRPVAIAGIMGGAETEVTASTKDVFLESAFFEPTSIRRTSRTLSLKSESSYRFERGADIEFLSMALDRAASLMQKIADGKVYGKLDVYPKRFVPVSVNVRYDKVNRILGTTISHEDMVNISKRLKIDIVQHDTDSFTATPPAFRPDIKRDTDIIEEIARIYGYNRIKTTLPKAFISAADTDHRRMTVQRIKDIISNAGFNEAINYSFMNEANLDMLNIAQEDRRRNTISIQNPLRKENSLLRTTLMPSMIENFLHNFSRGVKDIRIFEVARIFENMGRPLPLEISCLSGIYYREKTPSLWKEDAGSFYLVKGMIESLMKDLHIHEYGFSSSEEPFLHAGQSCRFQISGTDIGFLGALSPMTVERLALKISKPEIIVFEIDMDKLISLVPVSMKYSPVPKFPSIERDIAIIVDESLSASELEGLIKGYPSELIEEVSIFDLYKGQNIPEGKKSLAFNIRYRLPSRTLTEAEVEELHQGIVGYITEKTGGRLRV